MYRDEREVLRDEVMALRREVEQARSDQARLQDLEKRLEAANRRIASLDAELGRTNVPRSQGASAPRLVIAAVASMVVAGAVAFFLLARGSSAPRATVSDPPSAASNNEVPSIASVPPAPTPMPPPTPKRTAHAIWRATVVKSEGQPLAAGSPCTIDANVVPDSNGMHVDDVLVKCGAHVLYDENAKLEGMASIDSDAKQQTGAAPGSWTYALAFSDVGQRADTRNQAKLDSTKKLGKVWSENLPEFRVDLAIQPKSDATDVAVMEEK